MGQANCCSRSAKVNITDPVRIQNADIRQEPARSANPSLEKRTSDNPPEPNKLQAPLGCNEETNQNLELQSLKNISIVPTFKFSEGRAQKKILPPIIFPGKQKVLYRNNTVELQPAKIATFQEPDIQAKQDRSKARMFGTLVAKAPDGHKALIRLASGSQVSIDGRSIMERIFKKKDILSNMRSQQMRRVTKTQTFFLPKTSINLMPEEMDNISLLSRKKSHQDLNLGDDPDHRIQVDRAPKKRSTVNSMMSINPVVYPSSKKILRKAESTILPSAAFGSKTDSVGREIITSLYPVGSSLKKGHVNNPGISDSGNDSHIVSRDRDVLQSTLGRRGNNKKVTFKLSDHSNLNKELIQSASGKDFQLQMKVPSSKFHLQHQSDRHSSIDESSKGARHNLNFSKGFVPIDEGNGQPVKGRPVEQNEYSRVSAAGNILNHHEEHSPIDRKEKKCLSDDSSPSKESLLLDMHSIGMSP